MAHCGSGTGLGLSTWLTSSCLGQKELKSTCKTTC